MAYVIVPNIGLLIEDSEIYSNSNEYISTIMKRYHVGIVNRIIKKDIDNENQKTSLFYVYFEEWFNTQLNLNFQHKLLSNENEILFPHDLYHNKSWKVKAIVK